MLQNLSTLAYFFRDNLLGKSISGIFIRIALLNAVVFIFILMNALNSNKSNTQTIHYSLAQFKQTNDITLTKVQNKGIENIKKGVKNHIH